jgi:amino acid transporter
MINETEEPFRFYQYAPAVLGVIASIPAIFFAFDGFYSASASQHKMLEPKRASSAMALGIAVVAAVYIMISIALLLGANGGSFFGLNIDSLANQL